MMSLGWRGFFESPQPGRGLVRSEQGQLQSILSSLFDNPLYQLVCLQNSDCTWQPLSPGKISRQVG